MQSNIPPFTAKGTVQTESFSYADGSSNVVFKLKAAFVFSYSNGWWDVRSTYEGGSHAGVEDTSLQNTILDCSRIPDGIRLLFLTGKSAQNITNGEPLPVAKAIPIAFPPPENAVLFLPWLTLCPDPELPWVQGNVIPRLTNSRLLSDSRNRGYGRTTYIETNTFLSEFDITNMGVTLTFAGGLMHYTKPFDLGFREFAFHVLDLTNMNGMSFPLRSVLYRFIPSPEGRSPEDVEVYSITHLDIQSLEAGTFPLDNPKVVFAMDARPPGLASNATVNYMVKDDRWTSLTNAKLTRLANYTKTLKPGTPVESASVGTERIVIWAFVVCNLAGLILITSLVVRKTKQQKKERK